MKNEIDLCLSIPTSPINVIGETCINRAKIENRTFKKMDSNEQCCYVLKKNVQRD